MRKVSVWLAVTGLALAVQAASAQTGPNGPNGPSPNPNPPGSGNDAFVPEPTQRTFTVTGTVVREKSGQLVLQIDDHKHRIPFQVAPGADRDVQPGSRVSVTYHPTGATGQLAEQVQVLEQPRTAGRKGSSEDRTRR